MTYGGGRISPPTQLFPTSINRQLTANGRDLACQMHGGGLSLKTLLRMRPRDWPAIRQRAVSHPHEAVPYAGTGRLAAQTTMCNASVPGTPLHDAVQKYAPADVVKVIIQAYPPSLFMGNEWNRTPLMVACDDCCIKDEVIIALLEGRAKYSRYAESVHALGCSASIGDTFAPWQSYAFPRENGQMHSPGPEEQRAASFRSNIGRYVPEGGFDPRLVDQMEEEREVVKIPPSSSLFRFWRLLLLELRTNWMLGIGSGGFSRNELPRELHSVVSAQCPVPVIGLAAHLHSNQLGECDENGNIPLHIAAQSLTNSYEGIYDDEKLKMCHKAKRCRGAGRRETLLPTTIDVLVSAYPRGASIVNAEGRFSINVALEAGNTWSLGGIRSLHNAAPYVLGHRDSKTGLFPFMIAAIGSVTNICNNDGDNDAGASDESERRDLDHFETIYQLLRALPEVACSA